MVPEDRALLKKAVERYGSSQPAFYRFFEDILSLFGDLEDMHRELQEARAEVATMSAQLHSRGFSRCGICGGWYWKTEEDLLTEGRCRPCTDQEANNKAEDMVKWYWKTEEDLLTEGRCRPCTDQEANNKAEDMVKKYGHHSPI